jgi:hypothetical protein
MAISPIVIIQSEAPAEMSDPHEVSVGERLPEGEANEDLAQPNSVGLRDVAPVSVEKMDERVRCCRRRLVDADNR